MLFGEINKYFERTRPRKLSFGGFQMSDVGQRRKCKRIIIIVVLFTKIRGAKSNTSVSTYTVTIPEKAEPPDRGLFLRKTVAVIE